MIPGLMNWLESASSGKSYAANLSATITLNGEEPNITTATSIFMQKKKQYSVGTIHCSFRFLQLAKKQTHTQRGEPFKMLNGFDFMFFCDATLIWMSHNPQSQKKKETWIRRQSAQPWFQFSQWTLAVLQLKKKPLQPKKAFSPWAAIKKESVKLLKGRTELQLWVFLLWIWR